jgi:hypothetical protein
MQKSENSENSTSKLYRAGLLVIALIAFSVVVAWWGHDFDWRLKVLTPICFTFLVGLLIRWTYFWLRDASYKRRSKRWENDPAEKIEKPDGTKKPEEYDEVKAAHGAQWKYIPDAARAQRGYFANGILAAVLAPMSLLLISLQLLVWAEGGWWAVGLIISEVGCLISLVFLAMVFREPTAEWVENRIRTELFRREQYLALGGVGPYLRLDGAGTSEEVARRCGGIDSANTLELVRLIPMQERPGKTWLESLHHLPESDLSGRSDCIERMQSYLYYRIGKQIQWFANSVRDCKENDHLWSVFLVCTILAAIMLGCFHVGHLVFGAIQCVNPERNRGLWVSLVEVLIVVLPPLGTACLSIQNMYNFRGRNRIYTHEKALLRLQKGELEALLLKARALSSGGLSDHDRGKIDFEFRAIVLRTEHTLSVEMEQWMLLMEKSEIEVSS